MLIRLTYGLGTTAYLIAQLQRCQKNCSKTSAKRVTFLEADGIESELRCCNRLLDNKKVVLREFKAQKANFRQSIVECFVLAL